MPALSIGALALPPMGLLDPQHAERAILVAQYPAAQYAALRLDADAADAERIIGMTRSSREVSDLYVQRSLTSGASDSRSGRIVLVAVIGEAAPVAR